MRIRKLLMLLSITLIVLLFVGCSLVHNDVDNIKPEDDDQQHINYGNINPDGSVTQDENIQNNGGNDMNTDNTVNTETITTDNIKAVRDKVWSQYIESISKDETRRKEFEDEEMFYGDDSIRYESFKVGEEPEDGYPLYIALHGGGQVPEEFHDQQWNHMKRYYRWSVKTGVYVAARGMRRLWNTHFQDESYPLYDRLIENMIAFENINPNKVYIMGFSAGGDGIYQIAPRMADRFAAVNMSAGHPNGVSLINVKNLPFAIQVGEKDTAYDRHLQAAQYDQKLLELEKSEGGYVHQTFIHVDKPHNFLDNDYKREDQPIRADIVAWLEGKESPVKKVNTNAVDWVNQYERNPYPASIYWDLTTQANLRLTNSFYWLKLNSPAESGEIKASLNAETNSIIIETTEVQENFTVLLNEDILDIFKAVNIQIDDQEFVVEVEPTEEYLAKTTFERGDYNYQFAAGIRLSRVDGKWTAQDDK